MKLHLGCGGVIKPGFVNIDIRAGKGVTVLDLRKTLPYKTSSVDRIETYHFLEHLPRDASSRLLVDCFRVLKPNGWIVIEVPDILGLAKILVEGNLKAIHHIYGLQRPDRGKADFHLWGYCPQTISKLLRNIGFVEVFTGPGTDYHSKKEPCLRAEAKKG